jgi:uncharacterized DUF497 family protein
MNDDVFEWDDAKAAENQRRHGVSFHKEPERYATRSPSNGSTIARNMARSGSTCSEYARV